MCVDGQPLRRRSDDAQAFLVIKNISVEPASIHRHAMIHRATSTSYSMHCILHWLVSDQQDVLRGPGFVGSLYVINEPSAGQA